MVTDPDDSVCTETFAALGESSRPSEVNSPPLPWLLGAEDDDVSPQLRVLMVAGMDCLISLLL